MSKLESRKNVFLDLDNTLICSENYDENLLKHILLYGYKYDFIYPYITVERPNLQIFLDYLFYNFNVSVWTAATKGYASFVVDKFVTQRNHDRILKFLLFNEHCDSSMKYTNGLKSLNMLWDIWKIPGFTKENTIIIDDLIDVYNIQPKNCFRIKQFNIRNGEKDLELKRLIKKLELWKKK